MIWMHKSLITNFFFLDIHSKPLCKDSGQGLCPLLVEQPSCLKVPSFNTHNNFMKNSRTDICILKIRKLA